MASTAPKATPLWQAPGVQCYGDIRFAEGVSLWPNVVIRAESNHVEIGAFTNIQDFSMIHIGGGPSVIGAYCSITHHCTIHGAVIGDHCLIGINATVMDGANVGDNSIVAGHTIIAEGTVIPDNSVVAGVPGKVVGTRNNYVANKLNAMAYWENAKAYANGYYRRWSDADHQAQMKDWQTQFEQDLQ